MEITLIVLTAIIAAPNLVGWGILGKRLWSNRHKKLEQVTPDGKKIDWAGVLTLVSVGGLGYWLAKN